MSLKARISRLEHPDGRAEDEHLVAIFHFDGKSVNVGGETMTTAEYEACLEARTAVAKAAGRNLKVIRLHVVNAQREPLVDSEPKHQLGHIGFAIQHDRLTRTRVDFRVEV